MKSLFFFSCKNNMINFNSFIFFLFFFCKIVIVIIRNNFNIFCVIPLFPKSKFCSRKALLCQRIRSCFLPFRYMYNFCYHRGLVEEILISGLSDSSKRIFRLMIASISTKPLGSLQFSPFSLPTKQSSLPNNHHSRNPSFCIFRFSGQNTYYTKPCHLCTADLRIYVRV